MSPVDFTLIIRRYADAAIGHHNAVTAPNGTMAWEIKAAQEELDAAKALLAAATHTPPDDSTLEDLLFG